MLSPISWGRCSLVDSYALREKAEEITYIQFQNELLASGFVDHLEVINKKIVPCPLFPLTFLP